jgi:hypothetical protein
MSREATYQKAFGVQSVSYLWDIFFRDDPNPNPFGNFTQMATPCVIRNSFS